MQLAVAQVDFLPASYRQRSLKHRDRLWRLTAAAVGVALLAAAWTYRYFDGRSAQQAFDELDARYAAAEATNERWANVKKRLAEAEVRAQLAVFLQHPWPTSRILAAAMPTAPDSVRLTEIKIIDETSPKQGALARRAGEKSDQADLKRPPAERDLERLQGEANDQRTVMLLSGETLDGRDLHQYIGALAASGVVQRAELLSLQDNEMGKKSADGKRYAQFQVRVLMRPSLVQEQGAASAAAPLTAKRPASTTTP